MATAIITTRPIEVPATPPSSSHLFLSSPSSVPNKHLSFSDLRSYGTQEPPSPPESPASPTETHVPSRLWPAEEYSPLSQDPLVYKIDASTLIEAIDDAAARPLPDTSDVFPWLHGLTSKNQAQYSLLKNASLCPISGVPSCLRELTIIKAGTDLSRAKLLGAISADELLVDQTYSETSDEVNPPRHATFVNFEAVSGFSVRNFKIQSCKMATCSDVVVYGDDATPRSEVEDLALLVSQAQDAWNAQLGFPRLPKDRFNTFVLTDNFSAIEQTRPDLISISSDRDTNLDVIDFPRQERREMADMTTVSEIANNVFLGPSPQLQEDGETCDPRDPFFDVWIEASDYARLPEREIMEQAEALLASNSTADQAVALVEFPSSGSFGPKTVRHDVEALIEMCDWIYRVAKDGVRVRDSDAMEVDGDDEPQPRRLLIHCSDGYTESSLLALAYLMYAECIPACEAFVRLHAGKGRNFFAYPSDKQFLENAQRTILWMSPTRTEKTALPSQPPLWMKRMDGSLPSRIMPYLYLGNLTHATNPGLLRRLGITHILSVGEPINWHTDPAILAEDARYWPSERFLFIDQVQDNGLDPLTKDFDRCLDFIAKAKAQGGATLVHCHRGVSRSATICIAEVMQSMCLSFPRAYCFVRARRLNVIIQPHLLFAYELLKFEEFLCQKRGVPIRRECGWATIAREIALLNKPYCKD